MRGVIDNLCLHRASFACCSLDQLGQKAEDSETNSAVQHLVLDGRPGGCPPVTGLYGQSTVLHTHFDSTLYPKLWTFRSNDVSTPSPYNDGIWNLGLYWFKKALPVENIGWALDARQLYISFNFMCQ